MGFLPVCFNVYKHIAEEIVNSPSSKDQCLDYIPGDHLRLTRMKKQVSKHFVKRVA